MTMTTTTATTADADRTEDKIRSKVGRKMKHAARFAEAASAEITPAALRRPHTRVDWKRMTEDARLAHIRSVVEAEVRAALLAEAEAPTPAEKTPSSSAPASADAAPAPATSRAVGRYLVACVAGCGNFIPARSAKPAVVRCGDAERHAAASAKIEPALRSPKEISTEYLIEIYKREAAESRAERGEAAPKKPAKKRRARRAVCANSPKPSANLV